TKPKPPAETKPKPPPPAKLKPPLGARPKPPHPAKPKPPPAFKPKAPLAAKLKAPHPAKPKPPPAARLKPPRIARLKPPRAATPKPPPPSQDSTKVAFDWGMTKPSPLRPILLMTLHDDYTPLKDSGYYLRTGAVSRLENNRLMPATDMDTDVVWSIPTVPVDRPVAGPKDIFKDLPATIYLIGAGDAAPGLANPFHMEPGENPNPQAFSAAYQVTSRVLVDPKRKGTVVDVYSDLLSLSAGDVAWKDQVRRHYLALPIDRRYRQLAEEIAGALSPAQQRSPLCRALAVRRWMQENLTYDYNPRHKDAPDPVASFLFGDRRGYCTHLSHTMAYLLRAQGVPARVGVGFLVRPERCGKRSAMMAYTGDAHAWAEMYLEGAGWVVVESATKGRIPPPDPTPDPHETDYYLSLLGETPALPDEPEDDAYAAWPYRLMFPFSLVLTLGLVYSPKIYRRLAVRFAADNRLYRVGYRAVLDRLAEVGVQRGAGDTWDEFAATVAGWAPEFAELTEAHLCGAFAGGRRFDRRQWLARLAAVRGRIAATVPASRRIAGLLNPLSWIGVK
ncbi:MAG: transglutaminase domain-containing protein, partial [Thermoguttaceae bacterium]